MDIPSFSSLEQHLDFLCLQGVKKGVFPGGAGAVFSGHGTNIVQVTAQSGQTRLDEKGRKLDKNVFFDLASLTKPLATSLLFYSLIEQGILDWDDRYIDICKRKIPPDKKNITFAHLLSHSSGLSSYRPYFELFKPDSEEENKEKLLTLIIHDSLEYETGTKCAYSDLGFILLGDVIEQVSGQPLDIFFNEQITGPLGLTDDLFFLPLADRKKYQNKVFAATEHCRWRNRVIQGEVHDEHCFLMGGVAGHAGLFGTINGVVQLCSSIMKSWQGGKTTLSVGQNVLNKGLKRKYEDGRTWCLGFDTPSTENTSAGRYISIRSVGHLGYSGTSFWIDPEKNTVLILLTNRVHPDRENTKIREFRPWFHDRVMEFLFPLNQC